MYGQKSSSISSFIIVTQNFFSLTFFLQISFCLMAKFNKSKLDLGQVGSEYYRLRLRKKKFNETFIKR